MLINPYSYNFLDKTIFDLQRTVDSVHLAHISSPSYHCITSDTKNDDNLPSLKIGVYILINTWNKFQRTCYNELSKKGLKTKRK